MNNERYKTMALSESTLDLIVVGELNVDLILEQVSALPALEQEQIAEGMMLTLGSSSAILAANARALGLRVGFVGRVGSDSFGELVRDHLAARGIDTPHVIETPDGTTGLTVVFTHGNRRGMLTYPGVMEDLTIDDVPWTYVERARHLHVSSYYLQAGLRPDCPELFRRARALGLSTSFDTNWDPEDAWGDDVLHVLEHVDVFLPNDEEARRITQTDDLDVALVRLAQRAGTVVATCGADGVRAQRGDETLALPAIPVEPVDAIGAGDSFNAGFLRQYVRGRSLEECLRYGLLAGAFSTTAAGGTAAFDGVAHFQQFAEQHTAAPTT